MAKITIRAVQALRPGETIWDDVIPGFGCRCQRKAKVYILKKRVNGRQRQFSIGQHGAPWTPDKAREKALSLLGDIADNVDVAGLREQRKANMTVAELVADFIRDHIEAKLKASTVASHSDLLNRLVVPALGKLAVRSVEYADIARFHSSLSATPRQANLALAIMSKMFSWAERQGHRDRETNPCKGVDRFKETKRERFLSESEISRLAGVLIAAEKAQARLDELIQQKQEAPSYKARREAQKAIAQTEKEAEAPNVIGAIRLLLFTGCRLSEILTLQWADVDLERAMLLLPDSKTGRKSVYLSAPAMEVLATMPKRASNPHVIWGDGETGRLINLQKPWRRIRAKAGLDDVRIHDLRHSFASIAAAGGASLHIIGVLLGHKQAATTARYSHLSADPVRAANEAIGERLAALMKGEGDGAEVVDLQEAKRKGGGG